MYYPETHPDLREKIKEWSMHWDADRFLREALIKAYYAGREDMWTHMQALKEAILEREKEIDDEAKAKAASPQEQV